MEHLLVVAGILATATFGTGILLPLLARRATTDADRQAGEQALADEFLGGNRTLAR